MTLVETLDLGGRRSSSNCDHSTPYLRSHTTVTGNDRRIRCVDRVYGCSGRREGCCLGPAGDSLWEEGRGETEWC